MRNDAAIVVTTTSPFPQYFFDELEKRGKVQKLADFKAVNDMAGYEKALAGCEIAVASGGSSFKEKDYAIAKKLKLIADFGVGYDGIDIPCANAHRVLVSHTPNVLNDDVADLAVALTLNITRDLVGAHNYAVAGRWEKEGGYPLTTAMHGLKTGIVGMGRIGKEIASRLSAFKLSIGYTARHQKSDVGYTYFADIHALASWADVLILALPSTPESFHLVDATVLRELGKDGFLVNIARGAIVDTAALIEALGNGTLKGAALDVYEKEPHIEEALRKLDNVVLTPHVGSATHGTRRAMADLVLANIDAYLEGKPLVTQVPENRF